MDARQERKARNESLFREVNERIEAISVNLEVKAPIEFVCECDDGGCVERFEMGLADYEQLRADPVTFAVRPGHHDPAVEDVVREHGDYNVVRKRPGEPARVATEDAPP